MRLERVVGLAIVGRILALTRFTSVVRPNGTLLLVRTVRSNLDIGISDVQETVTTP